MANCSRTHGKTEILFKELMNFQQTTNERLILAISHFFKSHFSLFTILTIFFLQFFCKFADFNLTIIYLIIMIRHHNFDA